MIPDEELKERYLKGEKAMDLQKLTGLSGGSFGRKLESLGCYKDLSVRKMAVRNKPTCNRSFFKESSEEFFYFLGYVFGDGCISRGYDRVPLLSVSSSDSETIYMFQKWIQSKRKVQQVPLPGYKDSFRLYVSDLDAIEIVRWYGVVERKSTEGAVPQFIPDKFFWPFFLGLIDSDGTITNTNGVQGREVVFMGYEAIVQYVWERLVKLGFSAKVGAKGPNLMTVRIVRINDIKMLWESVKDYPFKLKRKWDRIESWPRVKSQVL